MKPRSCLFLTISILLLAFSSQSNCTSGCGGLKCTTSNGIILHGSVSHSANEIDNVYIQSVDSFELSVSGVGGCGLSSLKIRLNGVNLNVGFYGGMALGKTKLLGSPGLYEISGMNGSVIASNYFVFVMNPVGLPDISEQAAISVFPNPVVENLTLHSENTEIKGFSIYDSFGQKLQDTDVQSFHFVVPLKDYPPGIYFIHVATLSNKLIIKKIVLL